MLHVTNGESAGSVLRATGLDGEILCWNDVLHEGPVPDLPADDLRRVRARFLSDEEWATLEAVLRDLTDRDARLARAAAHEDVVLWFEHDLYDQLQLVQVIDQLADAGVGWARVSLVCDAEYLGPSKPERLRERYETRRAVTSAMVDAARRAWSAFRAPEPSRLLSLDGTLGSLRFLGPALRRHLQQFPSAFNGLSRSEHQALEAIAAGAARVRDAFVQSHIQREDPVFLGDMVFVTYVRELCRGDSPLVTIENAPDPLDAAIALTPAGDAVRRGEADRVLLNGIDRWLGGVHLDGHDAAWRWNGSTIVGSHSRA